MRLAFRLAAHRVVDRRRAERPRRLGGVPAGAGGKPDVGRVVGADGRRDRAVVEQTFLDREDFVRTGAHQRDVDQTLLDHIADQLAVFVQRAEPGLVRVVFGTAAGGRQTECHVGVLGIGQDEVVDGRVGQDTGQFGIKGLRLHGTIRWGAQNEEQARPDDNARDGQRRCSPSVGQTSVIRRAQTRPNLSNIAYR